MRRWIGPACAGLLLIGAGVLWRQHAGPGSGAPPSTPTAVAATGDDAAPHADAPALSAASTPPRESPLPQARSWDGTTVDGEIHLDAHGKLVPDRALRNLFDYLLTARGELTLEQIKQRLAAAGEARGLDTAQRAALAALFQRYLDYLDALPQVALPGSDPDSLRRTYEARKALRRGVLGIEMAEGFFAEDEARDRYEIDAMAIRRDPALTPEARAKALADLRAQEAPPALREIDQRSATVIDLDAETERLRAAGASAAQIQALRERTVGSDAAQRLAELDAQRAQWQQRVDALRAERDRILADPSFAAADRQRQIDALIARDFTEPEAVRLRAQLGTAAPATGR